MHRTIGIYVHVPFCLRRCPYCAFYSIEGAAEGDINAYPRRILQEFALRSKDWRGFRLGSVYFGGGTPSLLKPAAIGEILSALMAGLTVESNPEITLEANPGTLGSTAWEAFVEVGINHLSLGIQALDDRRLDFLGRIHNRGQAVAALQLVKDSGDVSLSHRFNGRQAAGNGRKLGSGVG